MATRRAEQDARTPFVVRQQSERRTPPPRPSRPSGSGGAGTGPRIRLTGRGGVIVIMLVSFGAVLLAHVTGAPAVNGVAFTVACVLTSLLVRPSDLLSLTVSPPLAYFVAALAAEIILTLGSSGFTRGVAIGMGTRLAEVAPWLFLGTALVLLIAVFRGLPANIRDFNDEINGRKERARQRQARNG